MEDFKFNFFSENVEEKTEEDVSNEECRQYDLNDFENSDYKNIESITINNTLIKKYNIQNETIKIERGETDLIHGVYEGGFTVWECTFDLLNFLSENIKLIKNKKIMELGCGHGLPGIFCLLNGSSFTSFQDYVMKLLIYRTKM
jgi:hypothetical protein